MKGIRVIIKGRLLLFIKKLAAPTAIDIIGFVQRTDQRQ